MDFTLPDSECWESTPSQNNFIRSYFKKRKCTESGVIKKPKKQSVTANNSVLHLNKFPIATETNRYNQNDRESTTGKAFNIKETSNNNDVGNFVFNKLSLYKKMKRKKKDLLELPSSRNTDIDTHSVDHLSKSQVFNKSHKLRQLEGNISNESDINVNKVDVSVATSVFVDKFSILTNKEINKKIHESSIEVLNEENKATNTSLMDCVNEINCPALTELIVPKKQKKKKYLLESSSKKGTNQNTINQFESQNCERLDELVSKKDINSLQKPSKYSSKIHKFLLHEPKVNVENSIRKLKKNTMSRKQTAFQNNINAVKQKKINVLAKNEYDEVTGISHSSGIIGGYIPKNNENTSSKFKKTVCFQRKAQEKLRAAKFRYLNEKLYTETGKEAFEYFQTNVEEYKDYHIGYSSQVSKWPINPVDLIIKDFQALNESPVIVDMGCGDAKIAQTFPDWTVYSFDLVALNKHVTACDVSQVPLAKESVDIVVFCLSLMGLNLKDYLFEAHRILKRGGILKIAEVESRIENLDNFSKMIRSFGFSLEREDVAHKMFVFLDFKKVKKKLKKAEVPNVTLKPCLYKKR